MLTGAALVAFAKGGSLRGDARRTAAPPPAAAPPGTSPTSIRTTPPGPPTRAPSRPRSPGCRSCAARSAATRPRSRTALQTISDPYRKLLQLYIYASLKADEDLRVAPNQERKQQAQDVFTAMGEATAWVEPEILTVGQQTIDRFVAAEPGLGQVPLLPRQHPAPRAAHA